jgi:hypothetical protein
VAVYTRRVQTVLTEAQYQALNQLSEELQTPVGVLIREAVQKIYIEEAQRQRRRAALNTLLSLNAPAIDATHHLRADTHPPAGGS